MHWIFAPTNNINKSKNGTMITSKDIIDEIEIVEAFERINKSIENSSKFINELKGFSKTFENYAKNNSSLSGVRTKKEIEKQLELYRQVLISQKIGLDCFKDNRFDVSKITCNDLIKVIEKSIIETKAHIEALMWCLKF